MSESLTIYQAMARILADIDHIGKDRQADMGGAGKYKFRGIDDMYNALHSSFAKYKVFIIPEIIESKIELQEKEKTYNGVTTKTYATSALLTVKFTFVSEDGTSIAAVGIGHALDTSDKATNKAQSAALKYCLMQAFLIPTEESKDVEDENIPVSKPASKPKAPYTPPPQRPSVAPTPANYSENAKQYQADLKTAFEILDWEPDKKASWAKSINPQPFSSWGDSDWESALNKAYSEINKTNDQ